MTCTSSTCLPVEPLLNVAETDGSGEGGVLSQRVTGECG